MVWRHVEPFRRKEDILGREQASRSLPLRMDPLRGIPGCCPTRHESTPAGSQLASGDDGGVCSNTCGVQPSDTGAGGDGVDAVVAGE